MKKLSYVFMIAVGVYALSGCNNGSKDAKQSADSVNKTKDTTTNTAATGGIAVTSDDAKFATTAAAGGMAEIELSKLAGQKSTNTKIKDFAAMMVTDHSKAGDSLAVIAKNKNITLPTALDADHQKKYDDLSKMSGADFDKGYVKIMVDDHQGALKLMQDEAANGKDADLKAFAGKVAPTVQMHLDAINKINAGMK
jgi:putative membrane protein